VFYSNQVAGANWTPWVQLMLPAGVGMASVTAARGGDGRIVLVGVDTIGDVWYPLQATANTNTWPTPIQINHVLMSDAALAANRDGSLELLRDVRCERDDVVAGERERGLVSPAGGVRRGCGVHAVVFSLILSSLR